MYSVDHPAVMSYHIDANDLQGDIMAASIHCNSADHICVVGGGASGVELAGILGHAYHSKVITLIHDGQNLVSDSITSKTHVCGGVPSSSPSSSNRQSYCNSFQITTLMSISYVDIHHYNVQNEHAKLDPVPWLRSDNALLAAPGHASKHTEHRRGISRTIEKALDSMPGFRPGPPPPRTCMCITTIMHRHHIRAS